MKPEAILATNTSSLASPRSRPPTAPPRPRDRRALLQPGAGAELRRGGPHRGHRARRARRRRRRWSPGSARTPSSAATGPASSPTPCCSATSTTRCRCTRRRYAIARGHRRRDALRLRLPDGSAGAARPDRSRHGVRDPRHDVQAGPRPAARAGADPQAAGHGRLARPQDRPRLLHLRGPRQPGRGRRRAHAEPPTTGRTWCARSRRIGVVGYGHDGHRHRRGLRQGRVRRDLRRPGPRPRSTASGPPSSARSTRRSSAASSRSREAGGAGPPDRHHVGLDDLADADLVVEAVAGGPRGQDARSSRTSTRSASPARSWPRRPAACRSSRARPRRSGRRTSSACTSSTRRR